MLSTILLLVIYLITQVIPRLSFAKANAQVAYKMLTKHNNKNVKFSGQRQNTWKLILQAPSYLRTSDYVVMFYQ